MSKLECGLWTQIATHVILMESVTEICKYVNTGMYSAVCNITAGHWPFSDHFCSLARQFQLWLAILSEQIREVTFIEILNDHPN